MLNGYNTNMLAGGYRYDDADLVKLTQPLSAQWFRFPGGTVANFYDWELQRFDPEALGASKSKGLNARTERQAEELEATGGKVSFDDFMQFRSRLEARGVAVVNVFTGSPEKSAAWVRYAKEKGYQIAGWELGNEMYLPNYRNRLKSVQEYIESAKRHAQAMRAVDKSIKLAVPVHAGALSDDLSKYSEKWNAALAKERFYDAVVLHPYIRVEDVFSKKASSDDLATAAPRLYGVSQRMLTTGLQDFEKQFGDRGIWFTEWNIMDHGDLLIAGTRLHALFCGDFFTLFAAPENRVNLASFHILAGKWNGYPLLSKGGNEGSASVRHAAYGSMLLVGQALQGASRSLKVDVRNAPSLGGADVPGVVAAAFEHGSQTAVLVSNRTSNPVELEMKVGGGGNLDRITGQSYVGGDLSSKAMFKKDDLQPVSSDGGVVRVAPLSFTLLLGN